ncbi:MAG: hypothetical protein CM15mP106_6030 [Candidatus Neomarinimicrobiota bacterium]|nr:MAG: hypothetical protein CM15mP106_6030 [Candidatus Neomarinimicrobiota bacterium]
MMIPKEIVTMYVNDRKTTKNPGVKSIKKFLKEGELGLLKHL